MCVSVSLLLDAVLDRPVREATRIESNIWPLDSTRSELNRRSSASKSPSHSRHALAELFLVLLGDLRLQDGHLIFAVIELTSGGTQFAIGGAE